MTKTDLVKLVMESESESRANTERMLNAFLGGIVSSLAFGEEVVLHGFGKFSVSQRKARTGRDPRNGKAVPIPAKKVVKFTVQKNLRDAVNG